MLSIYPNGEAKFLRAPREQITDGIEKIHVHRDPETGYVGFEVVADPDDDSRTVQSDGTIHLTGCLNEVGVGLEDVTESVHVTLEYDGDRGWWLADVRSALDGGAAPRGEDPAQNEDGADTTDETADTTFGEVDYACKERGCTFTTDSERGLSIHRSRAHTDKDTQPADCPDCGKSFASETALRGHVNNPHTDCSWEADGSDDTEDSDPEPEPIESEPIEERENDETDVHPTDRILAIVDKHDGRVSQETIIEETGWSRGKASGVISQLVRNDTLSRMPAGDNGQTIVVDPDSLSPNEANLTVDRNGTVDLSKYGPSGVTITPQMVIEALSGSQSVHQVERDLRLPRGEVEALLGELGLLEHLKDGTAKLSRQRAREIVSGAVS